ncbi:OLC1v1023983C1 [Oldenlandia corymbosa var. corymbosa]|uniref:OLC1v1023983C1 n=1 Tax=Oldenlandia corymbosa var. corymbosa TaxID=529605 RepID=A0AAV1C171_OLDCO|nr:OLC1v1023983C1 [Oldenlandia corymbosa var. corymbosa]
MMKALKLSNFFNKQYLNPAVGFGFSHYSTRIPKSSSNTLFRRILPLGDYKVSIVPILNQWAQEQEGRPISQLHLRVLLKLLRNQNRYFHALQLAEWMTVDSKLSPGDVAVRLDLICRVHGLEEAEKYFRSLPDTLVTFKVYGSLLNCYAHRRLEGKAEAVMQTMRSLGCYRELSYNVMLNLYFKLGKREKIDMLVQEMEEKGIKYDQATFCILLTVYGTDSNIQAMEKLLEKMENDHTVRVNWNVCVVVAKGYRNAGLDEKAFDMVKKAEKLMKGHKAAAYTYLLSMYASLGGKGDVIRIWHQYKKRGPVGNFGYFYMMNALVRLDDISGAEKIFQEWELKNTPYDFKILNTLIRAYTKKGLLSKAETLINRTADSGKIIPGSTWGLLAIGYHQNDEMDKAVDAMKKAIMRYEDGYGKLDPIALGAYLEHLKEKGQEKHEEFIKLLEKHGVFSNKVADKHEDRSSDITIFDEVEENHEELYLASAR